MLDGLNVLDMSSILAGPLCATMLGDHGANVIKVEHPRGDDLRNWGGSKDGIPLFWKVLSRNKRTIAVDLHKKEGQEIIKKLVASIDILIENFRPGTLERWGLGYKELSVVNPRLIMVRVTGFGQIGPYSSFHGFGSIAEAMSGFASVTGFNDGPPTLPSFGLADGIAGITGAFASVSAVIKRETTGKGEEIDLALYEPLMFIIGPHIIEYDQLGIIQERHGNESPRTCPRNSYLTRDKKWIVLSASSESVAKRLFSIIGRPDIFERYPTNRERVLHSPEIDKLVQDWISKKSQQEAVDQLRSEGVAVGPIYDAKQIYFDNHFNQRGSLLKFQDNDLGTLTMQGVFPKLRNNPGSVRFLGPVEIGKNTNEILSELGYDENEISVLRKKKIIR